MEDSVLVKLKDGKASVSVADGAWKFALKEGQAAAAVSRREWETFLKHVPELELASSAQENVHAEG